MHVRMRRTSSYIADDDTAVHVGDHDAAVVFLSMRLYSKPARASVPRGDFEPDQASSHDRPRHLIRLR